MVLEISISVYEADDVLNNLVSDVLFGSRLEFIQCIAALCSRYAREIRRKTPRPNKEISRILWSASAPDRIEWLMNNIRSRRIMPRDYLYMIPIGASGNENLLSEINSWSRSTNALDRSTLALRLRYYSFIKLSIYHLAVKNPLSHVVAAQMLLGRSLHKSI